MSPSDSPRFAEFLADFFAECEEHLVTIRRALLTLEGPDGESQRGQVDALLRSFHTLKGLAGMAGLAPVEQIAHQIEGYLRAGDSSPPALSPVTLRTISGAAHQIEQMLAAYRAGQPLPDPRPIGAALATGLTAAPPPAVAGPPAVPTPPASLVRVDLNQIDVLLRSVGDLVVSRSRLREQLRPLEATTPLPAWRALQATLQAVDKELRSLRQEVMQLRLTPIGDIFARVQFAAHDLATDLGRPLAVELAGEHTTVDKFVADRMLEPLLHLVRNAVSHGIEPVSERAAAGKPRRATVQLAAAIEGDTVVIVVADDGRGVDAELVARRAREQGLDVGEPPLGAAALLDIICAPGFSTREVADRASGRGLGLEIVRRVARELGGELSLHFAPGQGSRFALRLPLSLTIVEGLLVEVAGRRFAVPLPAIQEIVEVESDTTTAGGLAHRSGPLPLIDVADRLGLPPQTGRRCALLVGAGGATAGLLVGRVAGRRELVLRPLADPLLQVAGLVGAAELGDGQLALILDPAGLARPPQAAGRRPEGSAAQQPTPAGDELYLLFELAGSTYGLPGRQIRYVDMLDQITPLPLSPPALAGVARSRGELLPAIDLRTLFGLAPITAGPRSRLVVADAGGRAVGLVVDSARQLARIAGDAIRPAGAGAPPIPTATAEGRTVGLLDLDGLLERIGAAPVSEIATKA